jgi:hypothetical protein
MRKTVAGVSLAAFLALGAVACGSSSSSSGNNGVLAPSGKASATPSATASAATSASTTAVAGLQSFPFPADVKVVFQTPLPASGPKRGAMIGYENYIDSVWYGIQTHGESKAYEKYVSGNVLVGANELISEYKSKHWTLQGTVYYYDMSVPQVFGSAGAVVQSCVDVSGFDILKSNGKTDGSVFSSEYAHYQEQSSAGKTKAGYWMISHTVSTSANSSSGSAGMCI